MRYMIILLLLLHDFQILPQISLLYAHTHITDIQHTNLYFKYLSNPIFILLQLETKYKEYQVIPGLQNLDFPAKILRGVLEVGSWSHFYPVFSYFLEF